MTKRKMTSEEYAAYVAWYEEIRIERQKVRERIAFMDIVDASRRVVCPIIEKDHQMLVR